MLSSMQGTANVMVFVYHGRLVLIALKSTTSVAEEFNYIFIIKCVCNGRNLNRYGNRLNIGINNNRSNCSFGTGQVLVSKIWDQNSRGSWQYRFANWRSGVLLTQIPDLVCKFAAATRLKVEMQR